MTLTITTSYAGRGRWAAFCGGRYLCHATEPFLSGARVLLAQGADPDALVTMRHEGTDHDSFRPMRLGRVAGLTVVNAGNGAPCFTCWDGQEDLETRGRPFEGPDRQSHPDTVLAVCELPEPSLRRAA